MEVGFLNGTGAEFGYKLDQNCPPEIIFLLLEK